MCVVRVAIRLTLEQGLTWPRPSLPGYWMATQGTHFAFICFKFTKLFRCQCDQEMVPVAQIAKQDPLNCALLL